MLEKLFRLQESGTTVRREIVAGCTTFMTLSYIIFVQPAVLSAAGMDSGRSDGSNLHHKCIGNGADGIPRQLSQSPWHQGWDITSTSPSRSVLPLVCRGKTRLVLFSLQGCCLSCSSLSVYAKR